MTALGRHEIDCRARERESMQTSVPRKHPRHKLGVDDLHRHPRLAREPGKVAKDVVPTTDDENIDAAEVAN